MAKIISIVNQKGGTGKSACATNLGVGLAKMNQKVLIIDVDPQADERLARNKEKIQMQSARNEKENRIEIR